MYTYGLKHKDLRNYIFFSLSRHNDRLFYDSLGDDDVPVERGLSRGHDGVGGPAPGVEVLAAHGGQPEGDGGAGVHDGQELVEHRDLK